MLTNSFGTTVFKILVGNYIFMHLEHDPKFSNVWKSCQIHPFLFPVLPQINIPTVIFPHKYYFFYRNSSGIFTETLNFDKLRIKQPEHIPSLLPFEL